ncbi:MAG: hydroxyacid dehydrogenase [Spirochaetia bacterium]|nr:hydroxyacid dehydrogenase [Spirochaetia bacterium]
MKIGFCLPAGGVWKAEIDRLEASHPGVTIVRGMDECLAVFPELDAVVANPIDAAHFRTADKLKAVFVPFVGLNHLPADILTERGVSVFNCHGNSGSVAERALALALAGFGRIVEYHNDLREGRWHGFWVGKGAEDFWHSIFGYRCAVLGVGAIGQALARLLKAFDCHVVGYRRKSGQTPPPYFDEVGTDIRAAVDGAKIVFITLPLTDETRGLLGKAELDAMKGAWLINVGRGEVVVEDALYQALTDGTLAGAGLDVWYTYPKAGSTVGAPSRHPIHELPNVILSPHVAGSTHEAVGLNARQTVDNVALWLDSGDARHRVDLAANY